jgi:integrase
MALYKRGSIWWMSFQLNSKHVQRSTKCKNKRDAEVVERAYRTQLAKGEVGIETKPPAPDFKKAMKDFIAWCKVEHRAKPNTIVSYESASRALLDFFGEMMIDEIEPGHVEKFKQWRSSQKRRPTFKLKSDKKTDNKTELTLVSKNGTNGKNRKITKEKPKFKATPLKPATVNREMACLKIFFNYFIKADVLIKNPVSRVKFLKEENNQMRVVSDEEERLYLMAASQPLQDFAAIMIDTGMRPEEVARIERKNVHLDKNYLFNPYGKTKSAKRKIPLTERVYQILEKRMHEIDGNYLFATESTGKPVTTLKTAHRGALARSKVAHFRLYDLRHTFATRFVEAGGDLVTLKTLLGHANLEMVTRYAHPTERHQFDAIKQMEAARKQRALLKMEKCG